MLASSQVLAGCIILICSTGGLVPPVGNCNELPCPEPPPPLPCTLSEAFASIFAAADVDQDKSLTWKEFDELTSLLMGPLNYEPAFRAADKDGDEVVSQQELETFLDACRGEGEGEGVVFSICEFLIFYGPDVFVHDADNNGRIAWTELPVIAFFTTPYPDLQAMFHEIDTNGDEHLDRNEVTALEAQCNGSGCPPGMVCVEGEWPAEGEWNREGEWNGCPPGMVCVEGEYPVEGAPEPDECQFVWSYGAWIAPYDQDQDGQIRVEDLGPILFENTTPMWVWPGFDPAALFALVDANHDGFLTQAELDEVVLRCGFVDDDPCPNGAVCEGEPSGNEGAEENGEGEFLPPIVLCHSADFNRDWRISLSELLRGIQLFNSEGYHCATDSEDGFGLNAGPRGCTPHSSDYLPQDWQIQMSELLRLVQLFNTDNGSYAAQHGTEDGYAPGNLRAP